MTYKLVPDQTVRAATLEDAAEVADLIVACDVADGVMVSPVSATDVLEDWERPRFDLSRDSQLYFSGDRLVAFGEVWEKEPGGVHEVFCSVDPGHLGLGLGSALIDWSEERVATATIHNFISGSNETARGMLEARGYVVVRHFWHMQIELEGRDFRPEPPTGIEIRPIAGEADARSVHAVVMEAFAKHWGHVQEPFDDWWPAFAGRSDFDESLVLLAEDDQGPVGALTGQKGDGYGWVRDLGVSPRARGRGVGAALLEQSFAAFAERDYPKVILNVDAGNETGATRLYERVGMRQMRQFDCYEKAMGN